MQVMLDGRRFPPAEASSKKIAKKDAAAITLKILSREIEGGSGEEEDKPAIEGAESTEDLSEDMQVCLGPLKVQLLMISSIHPFITFHLSSSHF